MRCFLIACVVLIMACNTAQNSANPSPRTWEFMSSIRALSVASDGSVWWAGSNGLIGHSNDAGATWRVDTLRLSDGALPAFRSVAVTDEAAFALTIASPAVLFRQERGSDHWKPVYTNEDTLAFFDSMHFWDAREGIAMGDPIGGCLSILITRDGGNTWALVPCEDLPPVASDSTGAREAAFAASNGNIAVQGDEAWVASGGVASRIFHTADRGQTWEVTDTPIVQGGAMTGMFSAARCGVHHGIGWGGNWEAMDDNTANKIHTTDGGRTWELLTPSEGPGYRSCVQYKPGTDCQEIWAVGIPGISISNDGGFTWQTEQDSSFYTVRFTGDGSHAWLAGRNQVQCRSLVR